MTIEQLGSLGELIAAIATVITLAYLARFHDYWNIWGKTHPPAFREYVDKEISKAGAAGK